MFQVEICFQQLEICKSVCMFIVLAIVVVITTLCIKVKQSWMFRKHAHIPDNDYWGICLFHVVWTNFFFCNYSYVVHTEYIYLFSSTEHCAWAIISPKEFKSCFTRISFALLCYCTGKQNYLLSNILRFPFKICFWADF